MLGAGVSVRELVDFLMDMPVGPVWIVMMMCFWNLFWMASFRYYYFGILFGLWFLVWFWKRFSYNPLYGNTKRPFSVKKIRCLAVLGSGGHTMELLQLVKKWKPGKYHIDFVLAETDTTSEPKMRRILAHFPEDSFTVHRIPRAREVGQSWSSTILSTLKKSCSIIDQCLGLIFC